MEIFQMKTRWIEIGIIVLALGLLSLCFAAWDNTKPADSDAIYGWPASIRANWDALEVLFGVDLVSAPAPLLNVQQYGAEGDGVTDDAAAIQAAVDAANAGTIKRVYFPAGASFYSIETEITLYAGIEYYGDGVSSQIRQITSDGNVFAASAQDNIIIHDLYLYGPGDTTASNTGNGMYLVDCDYAKVYNVKLENNGLSGITFMDCDYGWIKNNLLVNGGKDSTGAAAITLRDSSSYNHIGSNIILNDRHGIWLVAMSATDHVSYNVVIDNTIKTCDRYGIILYRSDAAAFVYGNRIIGNTIRDISDAETDTFGAGIYCVGTKWTTIADNYIENTNQGTTADTLAPGGIGVTNSAYCSIVGNTVENAQWYGITVRDPAPLGGHYTISGNAVSTSTKAGIEARSVSNVTITGNTVFGGSAQGIYAFSVADHEHLVIADNVITDAATGQIHVDGFNRVRIATNIASDSDTTHGIVLTNSDYATIVENECSDNAAAGMSILSTNTYTTIHKNICIGNDNGIVVNAATDIVDFKDNIVTGSLTTDWTNGPFSELDNTGTPSVKGGRYFVSGGTTAITDFDDGYTGQPITVIGAHTLTITDGAHIVLDGSASMSMTTNDNLVLIQRADTKWYQLSEANND